MPISILTFACQALLAHSVWLEEFRQNKLGIEEFTLHDAWATAPFCTSPECDKLHEFRRIGPDEVEREAQRFSHLSETLQNRKTAGRSVPTMAVPAGLEPEDHFKAGLHACPTPHDVEFAARIMVEQKGSIDEWRRTQFDKLTKLVTEFEHLNTQLEAGRSRNSKKVSSHVSLLRTLIVGESICWPDVGLTETIQRGAKPLGQQESFGIFQERTRETWQNR